MAGKDYIMRSSPFWVVMQCILVVTEILGQPVGPSFKRKEAQENVTDRLPQNVGK
jgi:hypothetical protein